MVDYPNNPPLGASGGGMSFTDDPRLTAYAPTSEDYANTLSGLRSMAAAQGGSGNAVLGGATGYPAVPPGPTSLATTASAPTPAPAPASTALAVTGKYTPPPSLDLGYQPAQTGPNTSSVPRNIAATGRDFSPERIFSGEVPYEGLPSLWKSKLGDAFGAEAPSRYEGFRTSVLATAGRATPQGQMERDFANIAAGGGRSPVVKDYRTLPDPSSTAGPFDEGLAVAGGGPPRSTGPAVGERPITADPWQQMAEAGPLGEGGYPVAPTATTFSPHVARGFEGNPAFQPSPSYVGGITPSELTATDAYAQAQAEGPGVVGGPEAAAGPLPTATDIINRTYIGTGGSGGFKEPAFSYDPNFRMPTEQPAPPEPAAPATTLAEEPPDLGEAGPARPGSTIIIKPGDNLWTIAAKVTGNRNIASKYAVEIMRTNGIRDPRRLQPGQRIVLPGGMRASNIPDPRMRPDRVDAFHDQAATRATQLLNEGSDTDPFGGGGAGTGQPASPLSDRAFGVDMSGMTTPRSIGGYSLGSNPELPGSEYNRIVNETAPPANQRGDLSQPRVGTDLAALSANDNGLPGVPAMTNPSRPLPVPYQPNMMQDYFRGQQPLPVGPPANRPKVGSDLGDEYDVAAMGANDNAGKWRMAPNAKPYAIPILPWEGVFGTHVPGGELIYPEIINPANTNQPGGRVKRGFWDILSGDEDTTVLRGQPLKDILQADDWHYGMPESMRKGMEEDQKRHQWALEQNIIPLLWGHGSVDLTGRRSSTNIEDRRALPTPIRRPGEPTMEEGVPVSAENLARWNWYGDMGRPGVPWKSYDPMSVDYGVEARGAGTMRNLAQMMGLDPYASIAPWSPEYGPQYHLMGPTPNYAQWLY